MKNEDDPFFNVIHKNYLPWNAKHGSVWIKLMIACRSVGDGVPLFGFVNNKTIEF